MQPDLQLTTVNLSASDPHRLADFYQRLLGLQLVADEPDWVLLRPAGPGVGLSFQVEPDYQRPVWPAIGGCQQMMIHLEIRTTDLAVATEHALACGASIAGYQPQDDVRVMLDPDGHPFCLWLAG